MWFLCRFCVLIRLISIGNGRVLSCPELFLCVIVSHLLYLVSSCSMDFNAKRFKCQNLFQIKQIKEIPFGFCYLNFRQFSSGEVNEWFDRIQYSYFSFDHTLSINIEVEFCANWVCVFFLQFRPKKKKTNNLFLVWFVSKYIISYMTWARLSTLDSINLMCVNVFFSSRTMT